MERVDVLETRETLEDGTKFLGKGLLCEFDLSGVESCAMSVGGLGGTHLLVVSYLGFC